MGVGVSVGVGVSMGGSGDILTIKALPLLRLKVSIVPGNGYGWYLVSSTCKPDTVRSVRLG